MRIVKEENLQIPATTGAQRVHPIELYDSTMTRPSDVVRLNVSACVAPVSANIQWEIKYHDEYVCTLFNPVER